MAKDRVQRIEQLSERRIRGAQARQRKEVVGALIGEQQKLYISQLIGRSRAERKVAEDEVWKLIALDDLYQGLQRQIDDGLAAEGKLDKMVSEPEEPADGDAF